MSQTGDAAGANTCATKFWRRTTLEGIDQVSLVNTLKGYDQVPEPMKGEELLQLLMDLLADPSRHIFLANRSLGNYYHLRDL